MDRTYEGTMFNGQIRIHGDVDIPENTRVYVVVPDVAAKPPTPRIATPRLADPRQTHEFRMKVIDEASDADV